MSETLTNGVIVPDKGSRDWYADLRSNWLKLDSLMAGGNITINPAQTEGILVATITVGGKEYKLYQQDGDVSVKIDPSTENAEYPLVASTSAEANTGSVVMAPAVTVNPSSGAVTATSFKGKLEGNASTATTATKAVQDGAGAVIADTYATKSELTTKADDANVVHKSGTETIVGTKTFSKTRTKFFKSLDLYHDEDYKLNTNPSVKAYQYVFFTGKSGWFSAFLENQVDTDGASYCNLSVRNTNEQSANVQLAINSKGVKTFSPNPNNDISLGTSTNKWSEVWAKTFNGEVQTNTIKAVGGGANISLTPPDNGGFAIRAFNGTTNKELVGYPSGMLAWDNNEILTRVNGVTLDTAQTITGAKTFAPWTTFSSGINVKWITGNKEKKSLHLFATMNDRYQGYGASLQLLSEDLNGGFRLIAVDKTDTNLKILEGNSNGSLKWDSFRIILETNRIALCKNLTGANITPGGVVDCGNGNGKLKQWYLNADGTFLLSNILPTGIWKSTSFVTLGPNEGGIFIKLS